MWLPIFISDSHSPSVQLLIRSKEMRAQAVAMPLIVIIALMGFALITVHGAGGRIEGKVTDPKGAIVVGAAVTVTDTDTNQTFTAVTDQQGRFKVEGVPAGTYTVTISAQGFSESQRAEVKVEDGAVATADFALEIAPV